MRKALSASFFVSCALLVLGLLGLPSYGQDRDEKTKEHPNGIVHDWSNRHVAYTRWGEIHDLIRVQNDPRAVQSWQEGIRNEWNWSNRHHHRTEPTLQTDWNISLGIGGMAKSMYPAKFGFYPTATPTCIITAGPPAVTTPDFVVFTVAVGASATQPNIVAFQDLYSGTGGSTTGICDAAGQRPTYFTGDTVTSAATFWSYAIKAADGVVSTSPALSLDGTKVAFVEKGGGGTAHFHVLAYNGGTTSTAGDGVNTANSQDVTTHTKFITTGGFSGVAPASGSGAVTDLILTPVSGLASDTLSSPFVDMTNDVAYVGNDSGTLFRIKNVFCTLATCTPGTSLPPALDNTWGVNGARATGCSGALTGAVFDGLHVFVGCSDGTLYGFLSSIGAALTGSPLTVGNGALGGIVDPPLVDVVNGFVYVATGSASGTGFPIVVQTGTSNFSTTSIATLGASAAGVPLHAPVFNNAYFTQPSTNSASWFLYEYSNSSGGTFSFYGIGFNSSHAMNAGTPPAGDTSTVGAFGDAEISPLTELANGANDWIFASAITAQSGNVVNWNVASGFPGGITTSATEGAGTTGFIVDNTGAGGQESSIYFGVLAGGGPNQNSAVKLTQSGLQ